MRFDVRDLLVADPALVVRDPGVGGAVVLEQLGQRREVLPAVGALVPLWVGGVLGVATLDVAPDVPLHPFGLPGPETAGGVLSAKQPLGGGGLQKNSKFKYIKCPPF